MLRAASLALSLLALAAAPAFAQSPSTPPAIVAAQVPSIGIAHPEPPRIVYTFQHPEMQPARYTITIFENGVGHFASQAGLGPVNASDDVYPAPLDRDIRLDPVLLAGLFRYARDHQFFQQTCDRGRRRMAFIGNKTLTYSGPDGHGSCAFVWAADPALQQLSDQLNAVAFTLEIGRRLDVEAHHDPLGLDAELQFLQAALQNQQAVDLLNIAPQLQYIVADQDVMDRVRNRALALLTQCQSPQKLN